ncbi:MAG: hypothetical protein ACREM3_10145 [Candidatus Rokuibacteriota bacterium]
MMARRPLRAVPIALAVLAVASPTLAQPYRWVDGKGRVQYADRPPHDAPGPVENMNPAARYRTTNAPVERREAPRAPGGPAAPPETPPATGAASLETAPPASTPPVTSPLGPSRPATPPSKPPAPSPARLPMPEREAVRAEPRTTGAAEVAPGLDGSAPEMMALSGMDQWLDSVVTLARGEFQRVRWRLADPEGAWRAVARGLGRDETAPVIARCLAGGLTGLERDAALEALRAPLVRRSHRLRQDAGTPARQRDYRDFVSRLPDEPAPAARVALIQALERERGDGAFQAEVGRVVRRVVHAVARTLAGRGGRAAGGDDDEEMRRDAAEDRARFHLVTLMLFAYRDLSNADLEELVRIEGSPGTARFVDVSRECARTALTAAEGRAAQAARTLAAARRGAR